MIILFKQLTRHSTFSPSYLINHETVVFPSIVPGKDSYHSQYYAETQGHGPHYLKLYAHTTTQTSRHHLNLFISQPSSSLSTQVERPKAGGVRKTRKYPPLTPIPIHLVQYPTEHIHRITCMAYNHIYPSPYPIAISPCIPNTVTYATSHIVSFLDPTPPHLTFTTTCTRSGQPMHASCAQPEVSPPICTQCYAIPLDLTDI